MKCAVTICLVAEARGGPFVFWDDLPAACRQAAELGFDGVEIFALGPESFDVAGLEKLLKDHHLQLAAMGTGGGWVKWKMALTSPDPTNRKLAREYVRLIIETAARFGAPAIIGSMQGRWGEGVDKALALAFLRDALNDLGEFAGQQGTVLLYELINRYETNLMTRIEEGVAFLKTVSSKHVQLLADLFHMNIEEADSAAALRLAGPQLGHVHFVDSNRRPAGLGHIDYKPVFAALREIGYSKFLSAEALPYPDPLAAAKKTIETFRKWK